MNPRLDAILELEAESQAYIDAWVDSNKKLASMRIKDLLSGYDRDSALYDLIGLDPGVTIEDYLSIPITERDLNWSNGLTAMLSASNLQMAIEFAGVTGAFARFEAYAKAIAREQGKLTLAEIKESSLAGIGKDRIKRAAERVEAETATLSEINKLKKLPSQMLLDLEERALIQPIALQQIDAAAATNKLLQLKLDSDTTVLAIDKLSESEAARVTNQFMRRAYQTYTTELFSGGDKDALMIWVVEDDIRACSPCLNRAGKTASLRSWEEQGLPGPQVCLGLEYCRCQLLSYE